MPIASNQELHALVRALAVRLRVGGAAELAEQLLEALSLSSLPGEVLGQIRLVLHDVRAHPLCQPKEVRMSVDEGIEYVDRLLG